MVPMERMHLLVTKGQVCLGEQEVRELMQAGMEEVEEMVVLEYALVRVRGNLGNPVAMEQGLEEVQEELQELPQAKVVILFVMAPPLILLNMVKTVQMV